VARSFTLLDGGMGKLLHARGAPFQQPEWSALALMEAPDAVVSAHEEFIAAGADVVTTSNYAVVPFHLGEERFDERVDELVARSGRLARLATAGADHLVRVAGSVPPLFGSYQPEAFDAARAPDMLARISGALSPHIDLFLAETQSSLAEARASALACRPHAKPLWLGFTLADGEHDGPSVLRSGEPVSAAATLATEVGAEAVLFNCSRPEVMAAAVIEARAALPDTIPVGVYANAFEEKPEHYSANDTLLDHRVDLDNGGYSRFVERWLDAGAEIVGGCCGIMPRHIAELHALRG
jgi:S-methylmethionine-dependent homocysteine/selenocysteine methylase